MNKKILSFVLAFIMLLSAFTAFTEGDSEAITVYLTLSKYGDFAEDKDGEQMVLREISLTGKETYTLDDAFSLAHSLYYPDGEEGYASSVGEWGFGVDKLWGDTSYNFGYSVNSVSAYGAGDQIENGDYIDAFIYKNMYPLTEGYAYFDKYTDKKFIDETEELTLTYLSGYDESYNPVYSPCDGATITFDGEETEFITDENGKATISFEKAGKTVVSAKKTKVSDEVEIPAITAPVCVIDVGIRPEIEMMHNIANNYSKMNFEDAGGNLPWIIADMRIYQELFPDSENVLSEERKEEALKKLVNFADEATTAGDLAKSIIAIRSLGYDAKKVYTEDFKKTDIVKKLTDLLESNYEEVTSVYTVPYVVIALSQGENYAEEEQMAMLINSVFENKSLWQSTDFGTDAMTPVILALSPYYNTNEEIKALIDESVEILKSKQRADGLIDGFEGYESASTGLALCALSSIGIDSKNVKNTEINLIDGLLATANEDLNEFPNPFATEQGFRGLLAWKLFFEQNKSIYDFSGYDLKEANLSWSEKCPVIFDVSTKSATVTIEEAEEKVNNGFDLDEGTYTYTVSASGYISETGRIEISAEDVENRALKTITVSLEKRSYSGGGGGSSVVKPKEEEEETTETELIPTFSEETFSDVKADAWYYPSVKYVYENDLFKGTDNGFQPNSAMTRAMLVTVLHRLAKPENEVSANTFSDIPKDAWYEESVKWASENGIVNGVTEKEFAPDNDITREQLATIIYRFAKLNNYDVNEELDFDVLSYKDSGEISDYAFEAIKYVMKTGIMNGREEKIFAPKAKITRAEVATVIMRFSEVKTEIEE